jgi:uncharacterized protein YgiB involved in biofilm formation
VRKRKSSLAVTLVLAGAAAVSGCDDAAEREAPYAQRDVYASLEDCQKDWGRPENCDPVPGSASGGHTFIRYYGPWYGDSGTSPAGPRAGSHATDSVRVSRGGFGASAALHSSGG